MAETGLNQNVNRDYDPLTAKYIESDPIGLRGGLNTYAYALENPLWYFDANGREITCGGYFCGTNTPAYAPPPISQPQTTYYGGEGHFILGGGLTSVSCTNQCGQKQTFRYLKICGGFAFGGSAAAGVVGGMNGRSCRSDTYAGYFAEGGYAGALVAGGVDLGLTETAWKIPGLGIGLPNGLSGVKETGIGPAVGAGVKASLCYYIPLQ
jgi:uncharacterized protein RhaS with RHS repeats